MSIDNPCDGVCKGGPWDGKNYRHWATSFPLMKPVAGGDIFRQPMAGRIEAVEFGRYHYDGYGGWTWISAKQS